MTKLPAVKHEAIRTCIATGVKKPKKDMVRLVRLPDGQVAVDLTGKLRGRGANLDMNMESFMIAVKKGAIERALKLDKKLTTSEIEGLRADFIGAMEEKTFRTGNKPVVIRISRDALPQ
jgi:predicted RNA-binding protein YlxR (DUF448 family)